MVDIVDFSSWSIYDGFAEGSGRSEKVWLISDDGQIGLFKYPKTEETSEHISEHLASQIGDLLDIPVATIDLGIRDGRIGSMSYLVNKEDEALIEGVSFICGIYPLFNADKLQNEEDGTYYCIDYILKSVPKSIPRYYWIEMMLFDFIIGNRDRHQSNWALLKRHVEGKNINTEWERCPLYDNGSSLCCYVNEKQLGLILSNDKKPFEALVDSRSKSIIRIDPTQKKEPRHREVVEYLLDKYPETRDIAEKFCDKLNEQNIDVLLEKYPDKILERRKNNLIRCFLKRKCEILSDLLMGDGKNVVS